MNYDALTGSVITGYLSIVCWLVVFIPQLVENYKRRSGDGLSITFLWIWLAGDLFNLAGKSGDQLMIIQFLLALWYAIADICLIWQVFYYQQCMTDRDQRNEDEAIVLVAPNTLKQRRSSVDKAHSKSDCTADSQKNSSKHAKMKLVWMNTIGILVLMAMILVSCYAYITLPALQEEHENIRLVPQILGWFSAALYIGSRLPQLIKNWKQQSTEGLSPGMFICAVFGNIFYTSSIFLKSMDRKYIIINLSWIIGSLGTVIFDVMIFLQFYVFYRRTVSKDRAD
ncbi:PQ loop repeat-domain-containing protein [Gilbertella persicaria]|uniref:PQ loop repeat-domain-containing protein n=1 Tax=Gilbertella persicaria TaxID=101096 RepID=UPI0022200C4C|nr:PQ loop repeat-domain-containing protein [Gilbertella persicaria]KAI8061474.1 PQ loop repeat-domain-containing protein [Gilbertella persicaria]